MKWIPVLLVMLEGFLCKESRECCPQIFLESSGKFGGTQSRVLGIYTISNQRLANTPHPVYSKFGQGGTTHHVFYRSKEFGPQGWIVGGELLEDSFFITTGQTQPDCPEGIVGGFSGTNLTEFDSEFNIDCHSDQVKVACCDTLDVSAGGAINVNQGGSMGRYKHDGDMNGHPLYKGGFMNGFLFYRKAGWGSDGWVFSTNTSEDMLMVTTRSKEYCPDVISTGYDRDKEADKTLSIVCVAGEENQDPGVPALPVEEFLKFQEQKNQQELEEQRNQQELQEQRNQQKNPEKQRLKVNGQETRISEGASPQETRRKKELPLNNSTQMDFLSLRIVALTVFLLLSGV